MQGERVARDDEIAQGEQRGEPDEAEIGRSGDDSLSVGAGDDAGITSRLGGTSEDQYKRVVAVVDGPGKLGRLILTPAFEPPTAASASVEPDEWPPAVETSRLQPIPLFEQGASGNLELCAADGPGKVQAVVEDCC